MYMYIIHGKIILIQCKYTCMQYPFHVYMYIQKCILNVFWTVHSCVHLYIWANHILPIVSYVNWMWDTFLHAYRWIDLEQYSNTTISHIIVCPITLFTVKTYMYIYIYNDSYKYDYERKFKQWWSSIPPISTKRTIISHYNWTHWKQTTVWHWKSRSWFGTDTTMWWG